MKRVATAGVLLVIAGCAAGGRADRTMSAAEVEAQMLQNHGQISALFGSGTLSLETPEVAQNVSFELSLRKPDSIMVRIEGPFGIDLGLALLTRHEFFFYNSMNNELVSGPTTSDNLRRVLRIGIDFDDMLNLFSGGALLVGDRTARPDLSIVDDEYVLTYPNAGGFRRYTIDPVSFQVTGIEHADRAGAVLATQTYDRFATIDGIVVPRLVRFVMKPERRRLSIAFTELSVNPPRMQFLFEVPADAERARLQ